MDGSNLGGIILDDDAEKKEFKPCQQIAGNTALEVGKHCDIQVLCMKFPSSFIRCNINSTLPI